jgi:UDP-glucose 6-dehydrogenase
LLDIDTNESLLVQRRPPIARFAIPANHRGRNAKANNIRVAEIANVVKNTQRDINIALINELMLIFNRLGLDTHEVHNALAY